MEENIRYRHEIKYQCSEAQISIIRSRLKVLMSYDSHTSKGYYIIRSMYFDNYANRCFYENESGTDPREKYRIRIYNADSSRISLECKRKEKGKTYKSSCLITMRDYEAIIYGGSLMNLNNKPPLLRKFSVLQRAEQFHPVVIVEYDRTPFVYSIGNVRITLDRNIRSSNDYQSFFAPHVSARPIMPTGQHLLEIKYDELLPEYIKEVLQLGDLQQSTFSKYYLCRKFSLGGQI